MKWFTFFSVLIVFMAVNDWTAQAGNQDAIFPGEPIEGDIPDEGTINDFVKIGHVFAEFGEFGFGDVTVEAYEVEVELNDYDNDSSLETIVGIEMEMWLSHDFSEPRKVWAIFGIWGWEGNLPNCYAIGNGSMSWSIGGSSPARAFTTEFTFPATLVAPGETVTLKTHVRAFTKWDYDHAKANFYVTHSQSNLTYVDFSTSQDIVSLRIEYPDGTVIANNIIKVTAGDEIGEYYLHTSNGEIYRIDDTIPAYLV